MKTLKNKERGQSLVELSISLLVLLYLLSGAVEFGIAFFQFVQLRDAAQEGALYGSMNPTSAAAIRARVRSASNSPINLNDTSVVPDSDIDIAFSGAQCEGNAVTVTVTYHHTVFMPFMSRIIGSSLPLHATVTDTILTPTCP